MEAVQAITNLLVQYFSWDLRRIDFVARFLITVIKVRSVNLAKIASSFPGKAKVDSHYKRLQRFFRGFQIDFALIAALIVSLLSAPNGLILTLDRTEWKLGKVPINILVLGIAYKGAAFPILWSVLAKKGNSNTNERIELLNRFLDIFGKERIKFLVCDREFIGEDWFKYLLQSNINFRIRVRANFKITSRQGKLLSVYRLFRHLTVNEPLILRKPRLICGHKLYISGMRLIDGDYLIVVTPYYTAQAIEDYARRWEIETLFGCLKSRGFDLEETHLTIKERIERLLALLAIAFAWAHIVGEWLHEQKPLKIKKHGRLTKSIFRYGLDKLQNVFVNFHYKTDEFYLLIKFLSCT